MGEPTSGNALVSHDESNSHEESNPVNWNILVTGGKERKIDFLSSGERKGKSPNQSEDWGCRTINIESKICSIAECSGKYS